MFCKHNWKVLSETVTKSKYEVAMDAMKTQGGVGKVKLPWQLCCAERKHIQIVVCKCGKLKRFVTVI